MSFQIEVKPIRKETRPRDLKRKRLLLSVGRTVLRLPRQNAIVLFEKLGRALSKQK